MTVIIDGTNGVATSGTNLTSTSLILNGSTSGAITLIANATAGTNTITLPAKTGTILTTASAGSVLQVVNATYATLVSSVSATFADVGLSATITPSSASNKILCIVDINGCSSYTSTTGLGLRLVRTSTTILTFESIAAYVSTGLNLATGSSSTNYLDSPATTSATTYKIQFSNASAAGTVYVNNYLISSGTNSTMTLMEIAA
jgi:hypothetical protein